MPPCAVGGPRCSFRSLWRGAPWWRPRRTSLRASPGSRLGGPRLHGRLSGSGTVSPATTSGCGRRGWRSTALDPAEPARDAATGSCHRQAARGVDAAAGAAAARRRHRARVADRLKSARQRMGRRAQAGAAAGGDAPEPDAVQQRGARPLRPRPGCPAAAARRRDRRRQLRQPRGRAVDLHRASRTLPLGGSPGDAAGHRPAAGGAERRALRDPDPRDPGRSAERGSAVRLARRPGRAARVPDQRRLSDQGQAAAAVPGLPDRHGVAAAARRAAGRQAGEALRRRRIGQGTAGGAQLRGRRRAGLRRRSRVGDLHADRRRRRSGSAAAGYGRSPRRRGGVRSRAVGTRGPAASAAARPHHHQRQRLHGLRQRRRGPDRRAVRAQGRRGRGRRRVRLPSASGVRRAGVRAPDPVARGAAGVSAPGDGRRSRHAAGVLRQRPPRGRQLRGGRAAGARACARRSGLPAARAPRYGRRAGPVRARLAPVVLSVEQHSRRAPAGPGREGHADRPGGARARGAADGGGRAQPARW